MKDSKSLQPAWVFFPFFVSSEGPGSWAAIESEEQGAQFLYLPRGCREETGVFLQGRRRAGLRCVPFLLPEGPRVPSLPGDGPGTEGRRGRRRSTPQEPETPRGRDFPFPQQAECEGPELKPIPSGTKMGRRQGEEAACAFPSPFPPVTTRNRRRSRDFLPRPCWGGI